jgi:hypothetical protein
MKTTSAVIELPCTDGRKEKLISIGTLQGENGTYKKPYTGVTFVYPSMIHYQRFNRWTKTLPWSDSDFPPSDL